MKITVNVDDLYDFALKMNVLKYAEKSIFRPKDGYYLDGEFLAASEKVVIEMMIQRTFSPSGKWKSTKNKLKETLLKVKKDVA
jgi:hypothetical protein